MTPSVRTADSPATIHGRCELMRCVYHLPSEVDPIPVATSSPSLHGATAAGWAQVVAIDHDYGRAYRPPDWSNGFRLRPPQ